MINEFMKLPVGRVAFWIGVSLIVAAWIIYSVVSNQVERYVVAVQISLALFTTGGGVLIALLGRMLGVGGRWGWVESIAYSMLVIVLCALVLILLGLEDDRLVISNYYLVMVFVAFGFLFYLFRRERNS